MSKILSFFRRVRQFCSFAPIPTTPAPTPLEGLIALRDALVQLQIANDHISRAEQLNQNQQQLNQQLQEQQEHLRHLGESTTPTV